MSDRIAKWAVYSFLLSLLPFALLRVVHLAQGTDPFYWYYLWQRGELALVGFTLATVGAGELVNAHLRRDLWTYLCGGCTLFAIAMGVTCFTCMSRSNALTPVQINVMSTTMFAVGSFASLACNLLAERSNRDQRNKEST